MRYGLTDEERTYFDEKGFLIFNNVLSPAEIAALTAAVDREYERYGGEPGSGRLEVRNCASKDPAFLKLIEHPVTLPVVADLLGPNIKIRSTHLDVRPSLQRDLAQKEIGMERMGEPENWHIDGPLFCYPTLDGLCPMMEVKWGFYLTDVTEANSGCLCVVPGSHKHDFRVMFQPDFKIPREYVYKVQVPAGSAILFRTGLWHCVSPNTSGRTRKVLYYAYTYRWIHPSDYHEQSPELLARCNPIQRQLLGATAHPDRHPLGSDPEKTPCSFYWYTELDDMPILHWFKDLQQRKEAAKAAAAVAE